MAGMRKTAMSQRNTAKPEHGQILEEDSYGKAAAASARPFAGTPARRGPGVGRAFPPEAP